MLYPHYNHDQFRRYLIAFGSFFTNMELVRTDANGTEIQRMVVPIEYGPKEKWFVRVTQDPSLTRGVSTVLPRMSYQATSVSYDAARKTNTMNQFRFPAPANHLSRLYVGVPYNLTIELAILSKNQADAFQIVEQILPLFTPDLTFSLNIIPEIGLTEQVSCSIASVTPTDTYEGDFATRRLITWVFGFTMKAFFYGPKKSSGTIQQVTVDIHNVPYDDLMLPKTTLATEDRELVETEDGAGQVIDESTSNTYTSLGEVATVDVALDPLDQPKSDEPIVKEQITEYE